MYPFRSIPMRDVKPLAKSLLARFGDLGGVLGASVAELRSVAGVGESVALDIKLMHEASIRIGRETIAKRTVITSWSQLIAYVRLALANEAREQFRVLFLDKKNQLIADEVMGQGTVDHAPVYPREVMRRALELSASSIILVHYVARHIMGLMCPAPLCGRPQYSPCFPQISAQPETHNVST
jgi:DNA repair protein RadC